MKRGHDTCGLSHIIRLFPPANEVWGKVMFSREKGALHPVGADLHPGGLVQTPPTLDPTGYGQRERYTYPTGMHSCLFLSSSRFRKGTNGTDDVASGADPGLSKFWDSF